MPKKTPSGVAVERQRDVEDIEAAELPADSEAKAAFPWNRRCQREQSELVRFAERRGGKETKILNGMSEGQGLKIK